MKSSDSAEGFTAIGAAELASAEPLIIGNAQVHFATLEIVSGANARRVTPKSMSVMLALSRCAGQTVSHEQLLDAVWSNESPTPEVITQAIRELRRALCERSPAESCIQTVPKVGYRLRAESIVEKPQDGGDSDARPVPGRAVRRELILLVLALVLIVTTLLHWISSDRSVEGGESSPETKGAAERIIISSTLVEGQPSLSPDGRWLAFMQSDHESPRLSRVMISAVDGSNIRPLTSLPLAQELGPVWAHDGQRLAFVRATDDSCQILIARPVQEPAVAAQLLAPCASARPPSLAWAHDDRGLWMSRRTDEPDSFGMRLVLVDLNGVEHPLDYARSPVDIDLIPSPSPDGQWLAFTRSSSARADVYVVSTQGGEVRRLTHRDGSFGGIAWYPDSSAIVYSRGGSLDRRLFSQAIDDSGKVLALGIRDADHPTIAAGQLVYERLRLHHQILEIAIESGSGASTPTLFAPSTGNNFEAVYSPDGVEAAFISDRSGTQQIWLRSAEEQEPHRLTDWPPLRLLDLSWSGDGNWLSVVTIDANDAKSVQLLRADTTQPVALQDTKRVPVTQATPVMPKLLADGETFVWLARSTDGFAPYVMDLNGQREPRSIAGLDRMEWAMQIDGESLYFIDARRGELLRVDPPYEQSRIVASGLTPTAAGQLRIAQGAVWFIESNEQDKFVLSRAALPGPLKPEAVASLGTYRVFPIFEMTADASRLLVRIVEREENDIALRPLRMTQSGE